MSAGNPVTTAPAAAAPAAAKAVEQAEEEKLRQKYPNLGRKGIGTSVLQKRLNKGHKYFDSGDYNMAKARVSHHEKAPLPATEEKEMLQESTGDTIPTPDNVPAVHRKKSVNCGPSAADQHQVTHPDQPVVAQHQQQQQHQLPSQ